MQAHFQKERALGYQQITGLSVAKGLTVPAGTTMIRIIAETQAVRWRDDGTSPTATVGQPLAVGVEMIYTADSAGVLKFIEQVASAKLNVTYYG